MQVLSAAWGLDGSFRTCAAQQLLTHSHLVNYGGTYHSYLFARLWASQIWSTQFAADPLCRDAGQLLRGHMLRHGAAGDAEALLLHMGKGPLDASYYLRSQ